MPRGILLLVVCLMTSGLAGCLQTSDEAGIRDLVAEKAQLSVVTGNSTYEINRTLAQDTGLAREAAAAIAGMQAPLKEAFPESQRAAVLAESEYVHVAFDGPTRLDLPNDRFDNETTFTDLHLLFNTTGYLQGHILVKGPDAGGAWGTSYDMAPLSQAAFAAVSEMRPPTVPPSPPPEDRDVYQDPVAGPVPLDQDWGPFEGWVTGIQERTTVVVRNHTQLVALYSNLTAGMRPPQVFLGHHADGGELFEDHIYIGAFFGATTGGCDRAAIDSASYTANGTLVVEGRWIHVDESACQAPEHWPFQLVRVETGERGIPTNVTVDIRMENVTLEPAEHALVPFDELDPGARGAQMDRESTIITNQSAYNETWYRYLENDGPRSRAISQPLWTSFEHDKVVGIAWGPVDGWCADIGIHDVLYNGTTGTVEVQAAIYDTPGADCVDKEEPSHPATFVRLPAVAAPINVTFHDLRLTELPMDTLAEGWSSGIEDRGVHVITDQAAWEQLWADHRQAGDDQPLPEVDFDRATVIAAFYGTAPNGCYDVELDRFRVLGDGLAGLLGAYVKTGEACIDSQTQPYRIVEVPWHHGRLKVAMADRASSGGASA